MPTVESFAEFWPHYVRAHSQPLTRAFHFTATLLGWLLLVAAIVLGKPWLVVVALVAPYAMAWISHSFIEHNRPTTFGRPLWSWWAHQRMCAMILSGRMGEEVRRCAE